MTAKRFKFNGATNCIEYDNESILLDSYGEDIEELLNELHEEIEYLKPLANENTQYIDDMEDDIITFKQKAEKLEKENEHLKEENKELKDKNSRLQETLAFRSNQLALMEQLIDDLGSEEMARQMELILNDWKTIC